MKVLSLKQEFHQAKEQITPNHNSKKSLRV